jgi:two-component system response regulator FlrC
MSGDPESRAPARPGAHRPCERPSAAPSLDRERGEDEAGADVFLTQNPEMLATLELARRVATSDATVLIEGESGTGKELLARLVHRASRRRAGPLVALNCAALPAGVLERELFGHERGAFTGALERVPGKFELADGTTLLLDEIGELELGLQAKLLRVIQEKQVEPIGASLPLDLDFRVVATTSRDLAAETRAGRFREDLYYRLNVLPLRLSPLRQRPEDIRLLGECFLRRHARAGRQIPRLSEDAWAALERYPWPGNVRELQNLIERLVLVMAGRPVAAEHLWPPDRNLARGAPPSAPPLGTLRELERWLIVETLKRRDGNRTRASRDLGISLRTLRNKIHAYGICDPDTLPHLRRARATARPDRRDREGSLGPFGGSCTQS